MQVSMWPQFNSPCFTDKMKTVPDILGLGLHFRPLVMINTVLVMPGVSSQSSSKMEMSRLKAISCWDDEKCPMFSNSFEMEVIV